MLVGLTFGAERFCCWLFGEFLGFAHPANSFELRARMRYARAAPTPQKKAGCTAAGSNIVERIEGR
jgi:hypothetical protein